MSRLRADDLGNARHDHRHVIPLVGNIGLLLEITDRDPSPNARAGERRAHMSGDVAGSGLVDEDRDGKRCVQRGVDVGRFLEDRGDING